MFIHQAVLEHAGINPEAVAFVDAQLQTLTYRAFDRRVRRLAARLGRSAPARSRVAIFARKSSDAVTAMLATLQAGMAYVPIDHAAPVQRQRFLLRDASCALLLADPSLVDGGASPDGEAMLPVVDLRGEAVDALPPPLRSPDPSLRPDDEAYVLYTSGSTGTPKGVVVTHRNAAAFVRWAAAAHPLHPGDRVAVHAPLHFDLPVYDLYVGLSANATLHLLPERTALFPQALYQFLAQRRISSLYAVPSALTALLNRSTLRSHGLPHLRQLLYAGEEFRPQPLRALMELIPQARVSNLYGPIETNVITSYPVPGPPAGDARVPIGRPVNGVLIGLRSDDGTLALDGPGEGEIVAVGDCVTPGYLNRPDLTAEAMMSVRTTGGRVTGYRTGDYARRDADGLLHLLGRRDGLVKTRGYRVELGELEAVIGGHPAVAEIAVLAEPHPELTHRLHAIVVATADQRRDETLPERLTAHCRDQLPAHMVPASVRVLADLPRTSTGKIARAALLDLIVDRSGPS
jgi:amino acid adenylation domain-containing protein